MATRTLSALASNNTNALFRAWVAELHTALAAFGWVQATGVGTQIDPVTVTRPTAINTYQGYSVWQMNDSLQSTAAVFMRLDFGTGAIADLPALKIQVAIGGCDSSGNLTGVIGTQQNPNNNVTIQVVNTNLRTSGSSSAFRMYWRCGSTAQSAYFWAVEREKDTSGADTALGVNLITLTHSNVRTAQSIEAAGNIGSVDTIFYAALSSQTSQTGSSDTGLGPIRTELGPMKNPMTGILLCAKGDYTHDTTNTVTIYGASHTYLMLTEIGQSMNSWNSLCSPCLLWE